MMQFFKKYRLFLLSLGGVSIITLFLFYRALKPEKRLPIYQPAMVNFELVDSTLQHQKKYHRVANFTLTNQNGKTIIITTHYLHEAEELCNEIAIINEGKLIAHDTTKNIKSFLDKMTVIVDYNDNNFDLSGLKGLNLDIQIRDRQVQINYKPSEINFNIMLDAVNSSGSQIKDMKIIETKLEDVFLQLTQK